MIIEYLVSLVAVIIIAYIIYAWDKRDVRKKREIVHAFASAHQNLVNWNSRTKTIRETTKAAQELLDELSFIIVEQQVDSRNICFKGDPTNFSYLEKYEYPAKCIPAKELVNLQKLCKLVGAVKSNVVSDYTPADIKKIKRDAKVIILKLNKEAEVRDAVDLHVSFFLQFFDDGKPVGDWFDAGQEMIKAMKKTSDHVSSNINVEMHWVLLFFDHISDTQKPKHK